VTKEQKFTWAWVGTQDDQPVLKVDETQYVADFRQREAKRKGDPPVLVIILRTLRASQDKFIEEIQLEFQNM